MANISYFSDITAPVGPLFAVIRFLISPGMELMENKDNVAGVGIHFLPLKLAIFTDTNNMDHIVRRVTILPEGGGEILIGNSMRPQDLTSFKYQHDGLLAQACASINFYDLVEPVAK